MEDLPGKVGTECRFEKLSTDRKMCIRDRFTGDLLAAPMLELVIQRLAVLVHPQPHDVDMVAVDVGMLVHQIHPEVEEAIIVSSAVYFSISSAIFCFTS